MAKFQKGKPKTGGKKKGQKNKATLVREAIAAAVKAYGEKQLDIKTFHNLIIQNIITDGVLARSGKQRLAASLNLLPYITAPIKIESKDTVIPETEIHEPGYKDIPKFGKPDNELSGSGQQ